MQKTLTVLWPDDSNFARFLQICDDLPDGFTIEDYQEMTLPGLYEAASRDEDAEVLSFHPERLLAFAREYGFDLIDAGVRTRYAEHLLERKLRRRARNRFRA